MQDNAAGNAVAVESFASDRQRHTAERSPAPLGTGGRASGKAGNIVRGSKRGGCHQRGIGGNAEAGIHTGTEAALRTRDSGSLRERPPAGFSAAQRRNLEQ